MNNEQARNRNAWDYIYRNEYPEVYVPEGYALEGYAPAQEYTPVGAQDGYSDYQDSTTNLYGAHQTQGANGDSDYEASTASSYGTHQTLEPSASTIDDDDIPEEEIRDFVSSRRQKRKSKSQAKPKKEQPKSKPNSKRAERRQKIANEQGDVSSTDNIKGLVELREGVFQWWDPEDKVFRKAAYHDSFRDQFIREDRTEGTYVVAPDRGKAANDITSACAAFNQLEWRLTDRDSWGNVVDADGNKVLWLLERPVDQSYDEPERLWIHEGCVLLDGDNNPVRPWAGIPRCFSSKIEGGRIEALRRILPMTIQDIRGRMLRAVPTGAGIGASTKPLSFASTFGHRCSRFRAQYQTPAWISRAASSVLKQQVIDLLPEAEEARTTEGLQALSTYEINRRKLSTRGKFLYKGNGRTISEDERKERDRKFDEKLERQAASQPTAPRRPQSMPTQSSSPSPYLPTPPPSMGSKRSREDDGFENFGVGQSEPAAKRGRVGASPLDPRMQGPFLASQTLPEDPFQQAPNTCNAPDITSTTNPHHGQSGSNATGLGLNFGGGDAIVSENLAPSQNTGVPEPASQHPEATITEATASTNDSQPDNFQLDYRFVYPRNPLEQLRIQAALFYPRAHYYALIGEHPPHISEGTYVDQYFQIVALLEQNWVLLEGPPPLTDVGFWSGSFDTAPMPVLPDGVMWIMLHPTHGALPGPESSAFDYCAQGSSADVGAEVVQRVSGFSIGLESDEGSNVWSDDSFGDSIEGVEDADVDEK